MEYRHDITGFDARFEYGSTWTRRSPDGEFEFSTTFCRSKTDLWFIGKPQDVLRRLGIETGERRARDFVDLLDGDLTGFTYLSSASPEGQGEEAMKWIMGSLAALLNERKLSFSHANEVMPADYLKAFVEGLQSGLFDRTFAKDIFLAVAEEDRFSWKVCEDRWWYQEWTSNRDTATMAWDDFVAVADDPETVFEGENVVEIDRRLTGTEIVAKVAANPRFKAADTSEIDAIIETVIAANPDNAAKVADQPKLLNWFLGQVMKAAKGKAPAPVVSEKLAKRFGVTAP